MRCRHASFDIPSLQSKLAPPPTPTSRLPAREVSRSAKLASAIISWCMLVYSGVCWFTLSVHGRYSRFRLYLTFSQSSIYFVFDASREISPKKKP
jgi:hypothetical protein